MRRRGFLGFLAALVPASLVAKERTLEPTHPEIRQINSIEPDVEGTFTITGPAEPEGVHYWVIGEGDPNCHIVAEEDTIYYDTREDEYWVSRGGGSWLRMATKTERILHETRRWRRQES